jgi:probable addiction module antidote protein
VAKASYFDVNANLKNTKLLAEHLNEAFETGSTARIVEAIGTLARVKGVDDIAKEIGLDRVTLYRSIKRADIKLSVAMKLLDSFNVRMLVVRKKK